MAQLSIPSYKTDDPNYRYRMPRLQAKIEGRGNGIKTNIMNMAEIAKALKRPPEYPTRFCGHELGAQAKFEANEGKAIVNGAHDTADLQKLIDKFIEKFVLCVNCDLPELDITLRRNRVVGTCNACGHSAELDNTHKLATFIIKNPPQGHDSTMGKKLAKKSKERQAEKAEKAAKSARAKEGEADADGALIVAKCGSEEKKEKEKDKDKKHKSKSKKDKKTDLGGDEAESAPEDTEKGTDQEKKKKHSSKGDKDKKKHKSKKGKDTSSGKLLQKEALSFDSPELEATLKRVRAIMRTGGVTPFKFCDEVRLIKLSQNFNNAVAFYVALDAITNAHDHTHGGRPKEIEALAQEPADASEAAAAEAEKETAASDGSGSVEGTKSEEGVGDASLVFRPLTRSLLESAGRFLDPIAEEMKGKEVLEGLEEFVMRTCPEAFDDYPYLVKTLYDEDVGSLDEKSLLRYFRGKTKKDKEATSSEGKAAPTGRSAFERAKVAIEPFLKWLEENEEGLSAEEEDEEDDDTDEEGAANNTFQVKDLVLSSSKAESAKSSADEGDQHKEDADPDNDDEIDLDAL